MELHRILVVEDQTDIRKLIRMTLEFGNFEIHEASDGEQGLKFVDALRPHVVILDVMMPGLIDGYEVCRTIKADPRLRGIGVILLTARGQSADIAAGESSGADAYLVKPFSPIELIGQVEALTRRRAAGTL
jgi:DNA-binding response OmpR family regulator